MKTLYVSDLDGTLLRSDERTSEFTNKTINELVEKGLISKHKDKNGRSFNLKTTPKFKEYFKLKGDVRSLVKTLNIDNGVKDDPEEGVNTEVNTGVNEGVAENLNEELG